MSKITESPYAHKAATEVTSHGNTLCLYQELFLIFISKQPRFSEEIASKIHEKYITLMSVRPDVKMVREKETKYSIRLPKIVGSILNT